MSLHAIDDWVAVHSAVEPLRHVLVARFGKLAALEGAGLVEEVHTEKLGTYFNA